MTLIRTIRYALSIVLVASLLAGCSRSDGRLWIDNEAKEKEYFDSSIVHIEDIVHSRIWQLKGLNYEHEVYFELVPKESFVTFFQETYQKVDALPELAEAPEWFMPKSADKYDIFEVDGSHYVLIDKQTSRAFVYDRDV